MSKQQDQFNSSLSDATSRLKTFKEALKNNSEALVIIDKSLAESEKAEKKKKEAYKKLADGIAAATTGTVSFGKQLSDSKGSFEPLKTVVSVVTKTVGNLLSKLGPIGAIFGGITKAAGEVANFMIDRFDHTYGIFEKLSDVGVVGSFEDLSEGVASTRIGFDQMSVALEKHSKELALFGGSATKGVDRFKQVAAGSLQLRQQMQKMGVTTDDFAEFQLTYIAQQMRTESGKKKTNDELIAGTEEYINEIDTISKLTGVSRKAVNADLENRLKNDAQFRAWASMQPEKEVKRISNLLTIIQGKTKDENITKGYQQLFTGVLHGPEAQELSQVFSGGVQELTEIAQLVKAGKITEAEGFDKIQKSADIARRTLIPMIAAQQTNSVQLKGFNGLLAVAQQGDKTNAEIEADIIAERKKVLEATTGESEKLAKVKFNLEQAGINVDLLATSSDLMTGAMNLFSEGIENLTEAFYKMAGKRVPPLIKAREKERKLNEKRIKLENQLLETEILARKEDEADKEFARFTGGSTASDRLISETQQLDKIKKEIEDVKKEVKRAEENTIGSNSNATDNKPSTSGGKENSGGQNNEGRGPPSGVSGSGKEAGVKPDVLNKKTQLESQIGKSLSVTSGFRKGAQNHGDGSAIDLGFSHNKLSESEINKLFKGAIDLGFTGIGAEFRPASNAHIHLDTSHSKLVGWGSDMSSASLSQDSPYLAKLINDKNSGRPSGRTGGIFTDPGDMSDDPEENASNVGQQALNTNDLIGDNGSKKLDEIFDTVSKKMSTLISLMEQSARNQQDKLAQEFS